MSKPSVPDPDHDLRELVQDFKLLADLTRLKILNILIQDGETHVSELCERLGQSQPGVSHHLALMRVSGLIEARREGKHNYYSVVAERFAGLRDFLPAALAKATPATQSRKARRPSGLPKVGQMDVEPTVNGDVVEAIEETVLAAG